MFENLLREHRRELELPETARWRALRAQIALVAKQRSETAQAKFEGDRNLTVRRPDRVQLIGDSEWRRISGGPRRRPNHKRGQT